MFVLIPCIVIAFLIPLLAKIKFNHALTVKEIAAQGAIMSLLCSALYFGGTYSSLSDVQILNGQVVSKTFKKQSCPSGWTDWSDSFCSNYDTRSVYTHTSCSGSGKDKTCTRHYKTQYHYDYSWEKRWYATTSFQRHQIKRVNKRGDKEPARWTRTNVGDPASIQQSYVNYMKAAAHNIINPNKGVMERYKGKVPAYPSGIHDYYKSHKVLFHGVSVKDHAAWQLKLGNILKTVGPKKQANIVVLLTSIQDPDYRYAVEEEWVGGKKNDIIVVIGVDAGNIKWTDTITLAGNAGNELMTVKMRDSILDHKTLDITVLDTISSTVLKHFDRKAMKDFEYLKEQIEPPAWVIYTCYIMSLLLGLGLTAYFIKNDPFEGRRSNYTSFKFRR